MSSRYEASAFDAHGLREQARDLASRHRLSSSGLCDLVTLGRAGPGYHLLEDVSGSHEGDAGTEYRVQERYHHHTFYCIAADGELVIIEASYGTVLLMKPVNFILEGTPEISVRPMADDDMLTLDYEMYRRYFPEYRRDIWYRDLGGGSVVESRGDGLRKALAVL